MKRITSLLLCLLLAASVYPLSALTAYAADTPEGAFRFDTSTGTITGLTDEGADISKLVIPSEIGGVAVTAIGGYAFSNNKKLIDVTIPDSVTKISYSAFVNCINLESLALGSSVEGIDEYAFQGCKSLKAVTIPASVTKMGEDLGSETRPAAVFNNCDSLTEINVEAGNAVYASENGVVFTKDKETLLCCPDGKRGKYVIRNGVKTIGEAAFFTSGLTEITIPDSVTDIGWEAFSCCENLVSITIPKSVTNMECAFDRSTKLTAINVDPANPAYTSKSGVLFTKDMKTLFEYPCGKAGEYTVPDGVVAIGDYAFMTCDNIKKVTMPDSVAEIGRYAFSEAENLVSVTFGSGLKTINGYAFESCKALVSVTVPDGVTIIDSGAFEGCEALSSVRIGKSVEGIGNYAFSYCKSLKSVTIPASTTMLSVNDCPTEVFEECESLTAINVDAANTVFASKDGVVFTKDMKTLLVYPDGREGAYTVPEGVTAIGGHAFSGCKKLTGVTLPDGLENIGDFAFSRCYELGSVTLTEDVTAIGVWAFFACDELKDIYYTGTKAQWDAIDKEEAEISTDTVVHCNYDPSAVSKGDVNGDGEVDNLDAAAILQYDAGIVSETMLLSLSGDVNGDGEVDNLDAAMVLEYDAGLISRL